MRPLIRTSNEKWLEIAIECYTKKTAFDFEDDAKLGITSEDLSSAVSLIRAAKKSGAVTWQQVGTILTGLGMSGVGIWMIAVAVADPEPTSKLAILLAGGVLMALTGSLSILWALGHKWRVAAQHGDSKIAVEPT
jgi:hypothetical protein